MPQLALDEAKHACERNVSRLQSCRTRSSGTFGIRVRGPCDIVDVWDCLAQFRGRVARINQGKNRCAIAVAGTFLVAQRVRQTKRMSNLMHSNALEVDGACHRISLSVIDS